MRTGGRSILGVQSSEHTSLHRGPGALILASASPRRADILRGAGLTFDVLPSNVDEDALESNRAPAEVAVRLALAKARAVAAQHTESTVIGADTLVVLDGEMLGKPGDDAETRSMLTRLRGRHHEVITGVAAVAGATVLSGFRRTRVLMREYGTAEVETYIRSGLPRDKAGAYGIQDRHFSPVASVEGCRLNVVGLPLCLLGELLRQVAEGFTAKNLECPGCPVQRMAAAR